LAGELVVGGKGSTGAGDRGVGERVAFSAGHGAIPPAPWPAGFAEEGAATLLGCADRGIPILTRTRKIVAPPKPEAMPDWVSIFRHRLPGAQSPGFNSRMIGVPDRNAQPSNFRVECGGDCNILVFNDLPILTETFQKA